MTQQYAESQAVNIFYGKINMIKNYARIVDSPTQTQIFE